MSFEAEARAKYPVAQLRRGISDMNDYFDVEGPAGRRFIDEHRPGCPYEDGIGDLEAERRAIASGYTTAEIDQLHTYRAGRDPKWD